MESDNRAEPLQPNAGEATVEPSGPPVPVAQNDPILDLLAATGMILVVGVGLFLPVVLDQGACRGATRSARLEWEQRNAEIERAIAAEDTPRPEKAP